MSRPHKCEDSRTRDGPRSETRQRDEKSHGLFSRSRKLAKICFRNAVVDAALECIVMVTTKRWKERRTEKGEPWRKRDGYRRTSRLRLRSSRGGGNAKLRPEGKGQETKGEERTEVKEMRLMWVYGVGDSGKPEMSTKGIAEGEEAPTN